MHHGKPSSKTSIPRSLSTWVAAAAVLVSASAVHAADNVACDDSFATTDDNGPAYRQCFGSTLGFLNGKTELASIGKSFGGSWRWVGSSIDLPNGPFSNNPAGLLEGTLSLKTPIKGLFTVGLQGVLDNPSAQSWYSYYLFDGGTLGITSLSFDTLGIKKNILGDAGPLLALASLYVPNAIPEPATNALLTAGLGVLALIAHRRSSRATPANGARPV